MVEIDGPSIPATRLKSFTGRRRRLDGTFNAEESGVERFRLFRLFLRILLLLRLLQFRFERRKSRLSARLRRSCFLCSYFALQKA